MIPRVSLSQKITEGHNTKARMLALTGVCGNALTKARLSCQHPAKLNSEKYMAFTQFVLSDAKFSSEAILAKKKVFDIP